MADIVETAARAGSFATLVAAVRAAGLADTLEGPGPFTVFAPPTPPSPTAFAHLPPGTLEAVLTDKTRLTGVLTFHEVRSAPGGAKRWPAPPGDDVSRRARHGSHDGEGGDGRDPREVA
jgi:hypothetical protein